MLKRLKGKSRWVLKLIIQLLFDNLFETTQIVRYNTTDPFSIWEPRNQEIGEFNIVQKHRATDLEALKLWKGRSGSVLSAQGDFNCQKKTLGWVVAVAVYLTGCILTESTISRFNTFCCFFVLSSIQLSKSIVRIKKRHYFLKIDIHCINRNFKIELEQSNLNSFFKST